MWIWKKILKNTEKIMAQGVTAAQAIADLQAAEQATQAQITALQTAVTNGIAQLQQLIQNGGLSQDQITAIEAVVANMKTDATNIGAVNTQIAQAEQQAGQ